MDKIKNKNKDRTRASLFKSSEEGKQEFFYIQAEIAKKIRLNQRQNYFMIKGEELFMKKTIEIKHKTSLHKTIA